MHPSIFMPFRLDFSKQSPHAQAVSILNQARTLHNQGYTQVGITYSANHEQSIKIKSAYATDKNITMTSGANQATVIMMVEELLPMLFKDLLGCFRIIPICTMPGYQENLSDWSKHGDEWVKQDLDDAENFLKTEGHALLGWQNQHTGSGYAIGGGISEHLTYEQDALIQRRLTEFAEIYSVLQSIIDALKNAAAVSSSLQPKKSATSETPLLPKEEKTQSGKNCCCNVM